LRNQLINNKNSLIAIFEEMFGGSKNENQKNAKSFDFNAVPSRLAFQPA
jgi:hypothetical protein